jgi:NAD(P)-dependent dehydrogenase (short-subunit alcohol dehydrogenase family)
MRKPVCVIVGVGPGNGAAHARRFAAGGYAIALLARGGGLLATLEAELGDARAYECDVTNATSVKDTFARIRAELG